MAKYAILATIGLTLIGCSPINNNEDTSEENLNEDEAIERVEEHINQAVTELSDRVELDPLSGPAVGGCDGGGDDEDVTVSHTYWLRELPSENNEDNADLLYRYWSENGYEILRDRRPEKLSITVQNSEDAFRMTLRESKQGTLSIGASSPCISSDV